MASAAAPALSVPYELGFELRHAPAPLWSTGADVWVHVDLVNPAGPDVEGEYQGLALSFLMLASTGALCGRLLEPQRSTIADFEGSSPAGSALDYKFSGCIVDELSTVLCANTLAVAHPRFPIRRMLIGHGTSLAAATHVVTFDTRTIDPYPELFAKLPFPCDFAPSQYSPTAIIALGSEPDDDAREEIRNQILTWAAASASGCYAAVLAPPYDCSMAFDPDDIVFVDDTIEIAIAKFELHEAALRGLVNACAALHTDHPIRSISIA